MKTRTVTTRFASQLSTYQTKEDMKKTRNANMRHSSLETRPYVYKKAHNNHEKDIVKMEIVPHKVQIGSPMFESNIDGRFRTLVNDNWSSNQKNKNLSVFE